MVGVVGVCASGRILGLGSRVGIATLDPDLKKRWIEVNRRHPRPENNVHLLYVIERAYKNSLDLIQALIPVAVIHASNIESDLTKPSNTSKTRVLVTKKSSHQANHFVTQSPHFGFAFQTPILFQKPSMSKPFHTSIPLFRVRILDSNSIPNAKHALYTR